MGCAPPQRLVDVALRPAAWRRSVPALLDAGLGARRGLPPAHPFGTTSPVTTYEGALRVVEEVPSCAFAFRPDLALLLWGRGITPEQAQLWARAAFREVGTSPRLGCIVWITGLPASAPTDEVRTVIARIIGKAPPSFVGLHYVVEGDGFGSSIARSVVTGLNLMARPTLPVRVHQSVAEVLTALARDLSWTVADIEAIAGGMATLRAGWAARGGTPLAG